MSQPFTDGVDANPTADETETREPEQSATPDPQRQQDEQPAEPDKTDGDDKVALEELPQFWQNEIGRLRRENASRRTSEKDTSAEKDGLLERVAALEAARDEAIEAEKTTREESAKKDILRERDLDPKYLPMLQGDNAEAWAEHADSLVELRGPKGPRPDPAQVAASKDHSQKNTTEEAAEAFFAGLN